MSATEKILKLILDDTGRKKFFDVMMYPDLYLIWY
jgi:hypothetical protein